MRLLLVFFLLLPLPSLAAILPQEKQDEIAQIVLRGFWGKARLPDGTLIQPRDEQDRRTVPVGAAALDTTFTAAEISGLAEWCGLDAEKNFTAMMASARRHGLDARQAAFVATLHGFVSGMIHDTMKNRSCEPALRAKTEIMLNGSLQSLSR